MTTGGAASPAGARRSWQSSGSGSGSGSGSEREELARALPSPPPKPRRLSLRSSNQDADARLSILSSDLDHEFLDDDDDDGLRGSFASLSPRSTRTVSSIDDLEKRRNPSILFGRDVIQVPLKIADRDEYVNLVLSHREFDAMAVHIPQYDQMPPLELVEQIARVVKDAESKKKHKLGVAPADGDASGVFQGRVLEQEYEIKRLETKLAAARALQTSLTDENTTLRMNVRELEESELDYEKVYLQNELLREQALNAVAEVARMKRVAADARNQLQFFTQELKALKTQVANTQSSMLDATHGALADVVENVYQREKVLQESYLEEKAERQLIAEKYYELSGRIRVFCRLRPSTSEHSSALLRPRHNSILVEKSGKEFVFDQVFGPESAQPEVYRQMEPLVVSFADGYNACILAYGQTGSGKTYTMMGNSDDPASADAGMIPRALQQVFSIIEARKLTYQDVVTVSMVEIYNDQILDLLGDENHSDSSNSSSSKHQPVIKSESEIVERSVTLWSQVQATLAEGNANRNIASTSMNVESSRSHAMVFLHLESQHRETMEMRKSTLCLVDLAGSERISRSKVEGDRLKETQHINKSLSALGDVIYALQHKAKHVPYRNSKLTYMLRDMLSGQAKTLMMLQLSPDNLDVEETKCSLNFGARVSQVQMGAVRQSVESGEIFKLKDENQSLGKKVASLERKLAEYKQQYEQKSCELKSTIKSKRSLERQLWLLGGSEHDAPPEPSPQSVPSASPPTSPDIPLHPPSPTGSVKSTRSTFSTASSRSNRESGSTRRSLASSFSRLIGGRGGSSKTSSAAPAAPAPSPPGSLDRENRRKSLNGVRSERSTLADREARRQSLGARTTSSAAADAEARRRSLNPRADSTLDQEARRKSLSSLSTRTSSQSSLLSSRKVPEAPSSLPTRRPLFPTSSSSSSMIPPAPGSGSRIPKTRSMASSFTGSTASTPTRAPVRRTVSSAASPNTGSTISSNGRSASAASSGIASRGEPRRSTLNNGASARSTSTARTTATASASARRAPTASSWK